MDLREDQIEQIFCSALDEPDPSTRQAFVREACGSDVELRSHVESLLDAHVRADGFLEPLVLGPGDTVASTPPDAPLSEILGKTIGRYKIIERIGEGGFGVVYLAEQTKPVRRRVALKIIKLGMDTEQVIARFETERQALAMMDHPSIAKVLDAGATESGRPYFVMELVKGVPITKYCDNNRLSIADRLGLFQAVCDAAQHAHLKGIIHRDIKPSNVLVALADDKPIPKVIDFGVAKATSQRLTEKTFYTGFGEFVGTPEYMSPDQASISGMDVDTRTDIYSLGVLLYELLTGKTPFDPQALRQASFTEMQRVIREVDPAKPSTRVSLLTDELPTIASRRRIEHAGLARALRGDLDWIVAKAMEKDRVRRYQTASELANDIRRHLKHEPVLAGPPGIIYKSSKFVRRNRIAVIASLLVAAALLLGTALATVGFVQATTARQAMEVQAARSGAVSVFLRDMLASVDPRRALGREVSIRYILDQAADRIAAGALADQPEVEADLRMTLGQTYEALGDYDSAERHLHTAESIRLRELGGDHQDTLRSQSALVGLLNNQAHYAQAESSARQTAAAQQRILGDEHPDTLITRNRLGIALSNQDKLAEAEALHRRTLQVQRRVLGNEHIDTLRSSVELGAVLLARGEHQQAENLLREALDAEQRVLGKEHPDSLTAMNSLALALERQKKYAKAENLYRESWALNRRIRGPDHPHTQITMNNLLRVLSTQGKVEETRPLVVERLARLKRVAQRPEADARTLSAYAWELITCELKDLCDPEAALPIARRAVELDGGKNASTLDTLALVYQLNGDLESAVATQRQAIALAEAGGPYNLGELEDRLREFQLLRGDVLGAVGISLGGLASRLGESLMTDDALERSLVERGRKYIADGEFADAARLLRVCLLTRQKELPAEHWLIADTRSLLGEAVAGQGRFDEAEPLLLDGYAGLKTDREAPLERKREAALRIVRFYESWRKPEKAREWRQSLQGADE